MTMAAEIKNRVGPAAANQAGSAGLYIIHLILYVPTLVPEPGTYSGRGKFMPLPLKSKILETPGSLVTDDTKMLSQMTLKCFHYEFGR